MTGLAAGLAAAVGLAEFAASALELAELATGNVTSAGLAFAPSTFSATFSATCSTAFCRDPSSTFSAIFSITSPAIDAGTGSKGRRALPDLAAD